MVADSEKNVSFSGLALSLCKGKAAQQQFDAAPDESIKDLSAIIVHGDKLLENQEGEEEFQQEIAQVGALESKIRDFFLL